jgi:hypothetical protein
LWSLRIIPPWGCIPIYTVVEDFVIPVVVKDMLVVVKGVLEVVKDASGVVKDVPEEAKDAPVAVKGVDVVGVFVVSGG